MDIDRAKGISRDLCTAAARGVTDDPRALDHLIWALAQQLLALPVPAFKPAPELRLATLIPTETPRAYWLTEASSSGDGLLYEVEAHAEANPDDESRPFSSIKARAHPLTPRRWQVERESRFGPVGRGGRGRGLTTTWRFLCDGREVLSIVGTREGGFLDSPASEWTSDAAEKFAELLARRLGWLEQGDES